MITHAIAFLIGTATGAAGKYFADKYTDERRKKEEVSEQDRQFSKLASQMPDLFVEMKASISGQDYGTRREFLLLPKGTQVGNSENAFVYEDDDNNNYDSKASILAEYGYVTKIPCVAPKYRMTDDFVQRLHEWNQ